MHDFVLQDFTTIRGAYTVTTVTQSEHQWLDLEDYEDLVAWIDIREVSFASGYSTITLNLQTAPIKDEVLFTTMPSSGLAVTSSTTLATAHIQPVIMSNTSLQVPLGRFVRWQLVTGGSSGTWDMTFRVLVCANQVGAGRSRGGGMRR
jgi:hypothetical protein